MTTYEVRQDSEPEVPLGYKGEVEVRIARRVVGKNDLGVSKNANKWDNKRTRQDAMTSETKRNILTRVCVREGRNPLNVSKNMVSAIKNPSKVNAEPTLIK